jgi:hypothetical protein
MSDVERQQMRHAMNVTDGDQPRVVGLLADHTMSFHDRLPGREDGWQVGQQCEVRQERRGVSFGFGGSLSEPVCRDRPSGDGVKLDEVLRRDVKRLASAVQFEDCLRSRRMKGIAGIRQPDQQVRIDENSHYS